VRIFSKDEVAAKYQVGSRADLLHSVAQFVGFNENQSANSNPGCLLVSVNGRCFGGQL
jgi:hypothetical protein